MSRRKKTDGERIADWVFSGRYQARGMAFPSELAVEIDRLVRRRMAEAGKEIERQRAENARLRAQVDEYFREPATHPVEET